MKEYHKIQTVFKRDPVTKFKTLLNDEYSLPEFKYLVNNKWVFTEKIDGTNIRVIVNNEQIIYKGKTENAQIPATLIQKLNNIFLPIKDKLLIQFPDGVCFYGEGYGAKIQKGGGNYSAEQSFCLFDISVGEWWLNRDNIESIATDFSLEIAPIIGEGSLIDMVLMAKQGFNSAWGDFKAEGIVARPKVELKTRSGERIITKIKYKDFK